MRIFPDQIQGENVILRMLFYSFLCVPTEVMMSGRNYDDQAQKSDQDKLVSGRNTNILLFLHLVFIRFILVHETFTTCICGCLYLQHFKEIDMRFFLMSECVQHEICVQQLIQGVKEKFVGGILTLYIICFHVIYDSKLHSTLQYVF